MIEPELRTELSQDIRRLATGRMTNDAFDARYYEFYQRSDDPAIREIAGFGYSLYSSDLLWPIRLRGPYALDRETKRTIARCVLFLRSGDEYGWPPFPDSLEGRILASLALFFGLPGGIALTLIGLALTASEPGLFAYKVLGLGLLVSLTSFYGLTFASAPPDEWKRFTSCGDYDCWPFLRRDLFDSARNQIRLIGG